MTLSSFLLDSGEVVHISSLALLKVCLKELDQVTQQLQEMLTTPSPARSPRRCSSTAVLVSQWR